MPNPPLDSLGSLPPMYARLLSKLGQAGWFCQGTVVSRTLRRKVRGQWVEKGPYHLWTGKRAGKTICYALSEEQYLAAKQAIEANRKVMAIVSKLQAITLDRILKKVAGVQKRK